MYLVVSLCFTVVISLCRSFFLCVYSYLGVSFVSIDFVVSLFLYVLLYPVMYFATYVLRPFLRA